MILLPPSSKYWDYRHVLPHLAHRLSLNSFLEIYIWGSKWIISLLEMLSVIKVTTTVRAFWAHSTLFPNKWVKTYLPNWGWAQLNFQLNHSSVSGSFLREKLFCYTCLCVHVPHTHFSDSDGLKCFQQLHNAAATQPALLGLWSSPYSPISG